MLDKIRKGAGCSKKAAERYLMILGERRAKESGVHSFSLDVPISSANKKRMKCFLDGASMVISVMAAGKIIWEGFAIAGSARNGKSPTTKPLLGFRSKHQHKLIELTLDQWLNNSEFTLNGDRFVNGFLVTL